jgi:hypothetical protein
VGAVIGEHRVQLVRLARNQGAQEVGGDASRDFLMQLGKGELARAVIGHQQRESPFFRLHLGDIDMV